MRKTAALLGVLFALAIALSSCQKPDSAEHSALPPVALEADWLQQPHEMPVRLPLYYYRNDVGLVIEYREVTLSPGRSRAQAAIEELLDGARDEGIELPFVASRAGVSLKRIVVSGKTAVVDLEGSVDLSAAIQARVPIANTLIDLLGIEYVDIFYNGQAMTYYEYSLGAMRRFDGTPKEYYEQIEQLSASGAWFPRTLDITLYFPDASGRYLLCETRPVEIRSESDAQNEIARELLAGPSDPRLQGIVTSAEKPEIFSHIDYSGVQTDEATSERIPYKNVLEVVFPGSATCDLSRAAVVSSMMSLSLSGVEAIRVSFDGNAEESTDNGAYLTRRDLAEPIAQIVEGRRIDGHYLRRCEVFLPQNAYEDPAAILRALCDEADLGLPSDAISDAFVSRDCAVVNFDARHASAWQDWEDSQKRLFIYAIVNTLTELPGVRRVQFLENGQLMASMEPLSLGSPMLRNPGLEIEESYE